MQVAQLVAASSRILKHLGSIPPDKWNCWARFHTPAVPLHLAIVPIVCQVNHIATGSDVMSAMN